MLSIVAGIWVGSDVGWPVPVMVTTPRVFVGTLSVVAVFARGAGAGCTCAATESGNAAANVSARRRRLNAASGCNAVVSTHGGAQAARRPRAAVLFIADPDESVDRSSGR